MALGTVNARATNSDTAALSIAAPVESMAACPDTRELFQSHAAFVLRVVRRFGVNPAEVEDVAQEVFVQVHNSLARLSPGVPARSWLFGIVRRVVANHRRKSRRRQMLLAEIELRQRGQAAAQALRCDERRLLDLALERLDRDKREVFVLFELEGMAMREVAQLLGIALQTAYSRLYAARALVQAVVLGDADSGGHR